MPRYQLLKDAGTHSEPDGTTYTGGAIIETDEDLAAKFKNKFVKLDDTAQADAAGAVETSADVTKDFTIAQEADLQVLKFKGQFYVLEDGTQLNMVGLEDANAVEAFVTDHLAKE